MLYLSPPLPTRHMCPRHMSFLPHGDKCDLSRKREGGFRACGAHVEAAEIICDRFLTVW